MTVPLRFFAGLTGRFAHQRGRAVLSIAGIALGVALGFAVHLINAAALNEFSLAVRSMAGDADLEVRGGRAGFSEALYPVVAQIEGVAVASPMLDLETTVADGEGANRVSLRLLGIDALRAVQVQPALFADDPRRLFDLMRPDTVLLSAGAAAALGLKAGDRLVLVAGAGKVQLEVTGIVTGLRGISAWTDLATGQWRMQRLGNLNRIDLRLAPGADLAGVRARIEALLPAGTFVSEVEQVEEQGANLSRAYRVNLNVLALVALFTGGFLVFSAQALEVTRRRAEHGIDRQVARHLVRRSYPNRRVPRALPPRRPFG